MSIHTDLDRRRTELWANLRIVVLDCEVTGSVDGDRILSVGAVSITGGRITRSWTRYANPGVTITRRSQAIHGITNEFLNDSKVPDFADAAPSLLAELAPTHPTEQVVLCAHYAHKDIGWLRSELKRIGMDLPNYLVIDTNYIAKVVALPTSGYSLTALTNAAGVVNTSPHDALADATATAQLLIKLIDRGISQGIYTIGGIAGHSGGRYKPRHAQAMKPAGAGDTSDEARLDPSMSVVHQRKHSITPRDWLSWVDVLDECQALACAGLPPRAAAAARQQPDDTLTLVRRALDARVAASGATRKDVAVLVQALSEVLTAIGDRDNAVAVYASYATRLDALPACDRDGTGACCRYCAERQPCPIDTWHQRIGRMLVTHRRGDGRTAVFLSSLLDPAKPRAGKVNAWRKAGHPRLAAWTAWLVGEAHTEKDYRRAEQVWAAAWRTLDLRDPRIADELARPLASTSNEASLIKAEKLCDDALAVRGTSTDDGWLLVTSRRRQVQSARERNLREQQRKGHAPTPTKDGRRHDSVRPRKVHPLRFRIA